MLNARDAQTLETLRARDSEIYHTAWCLVVDSGRGCGVQHPRKGAWCCPSLAGGGPGRCVEWDEGTNCYEIIVNIRVCGCISCLYGWVCLTLLLIW